MHPSPVVPPVPQADDAQVLTILTVEYAALNTARGSTIFEANGRITAFLGALSSALVALAFVRQASALGPAFTYFGLAVLTPLIFVGFVTFERAVGVGIEDAFYAREMGRIRHYFLAAAPQLQPYITQPAHDDTAALLRTLGRRPGLLSQLLTAASMLALINSVLLSGVVGLGLVGASVPPGVVMAICIGLFAVTVWAQVRYQTARWKNFEGVVTPLFPTPGAESDD